MNILIIILILNGCSKPDSKTVNDETQINTFAVERIIPVEPTSISDTEFQEETEEELVISEEPVTFDSAGRPSRPIFRNLKVDTAQFFGGWANEHSAPNAAFLIDRNEFYIADFDGNPIVPYILDGDSLTLFYEWGKQTSRISLPTPDLLLMSSDGGITSQYDRFEN